MGGSGKAYSAIGAKGLVVVAARPGLYDATCFGHNEDGRGGAAVADAAKANCMNSPDACASKVQPAAFGVSLMPGY